MVPGWSIRQSLILIIFEIMLLDLHITINMLMIQEFILGLSYYFTIDGKCFAVFPNFTFCNFYWLSFFDFFWSFIVLYFDQLLGAAHTQKQLKTLFRCVLVIFHPKTRQKSQNIVFRLLFKAGRHPNAGRLHNGVPQLYLKMN